ncbi:hypothetical protein PSECIP111951_01407 [Pseudoalteromonas holothuriae]|uniref:Uncharacterized protein n=1 Tax=Pseudoalteromonas holothuriae TaxID=2963714 RepID=A0A9W4VZZ4_9GAMM|nr:hypothetical protein PSECIP111854_00012 [Pseudoalteromonas sp. CIP111854]CAH9056169.1 hypothetical protein PSECIP111951_01407 [Pseudoalteromonas sp. CIP111951]
MLRVILSLKSDTRKGNKLNEENIVNFAHSAKLRSSINIAFCNAVADIKNVIIKELYANYPDFF